MNTDVEKYEPTVPLWERTSSEFFCQNRLCRAHVKLPPGWSPPERMAFRDGNGEVVHLRRMEILNPAEKKNFDFCEVCANVLAIVHGKSN